MKDVIVKDDKIFIKIEDIRENYASYLCGTEEYKMIYFENEYELINIQTFGSAQWQKLYSVSRKGLYYDCFLYAQSKQFYSPMWATIRVRDIEGGFEIISNYHDSFAKLLLNHYCEDNMVIPKESMMDWLINLDNLQPWSLRSLKVLINHGEQMTEEERSLLASTIILGVEPYHTTKGFIEKWDKEK